MSDKTNKPKGLTLKRNGNKFTLEWKIADDDYKDGQQFSHAVKTTTADNNGVAGSVVGGGPLIRNPVKIAVTARKHSVSLDYDSYYPHTNKILKGIDFAVRGDRKAYRKRVKKGNRTEEITIDPPWSDWSDKQYTTKKPFRPSGSVALSAQSNVVTYSWTTKAETKRRIEEDIEFKTALKKDWNGKYTDLGSSQSRNLNGSYIGGGSSGEDTDKVGGTDSWTRIVAVRARGAGGKSKWSYMHHTFAIPNAARNVSAIATVDDDKNTITCVATWEATKTYARPIDNVKVEYAIETPESGMACPDEASWTTADNIRDTKDGDKSSFSIDSVVGEDKCLFVRVVTEHKKTTNDNYYANSIPKIAKGDGTGFLKAPTIDNVETDPTQYTAEIQATNTSDVPDSVLIVSYKNAVDQEPIDVGVIGQNETQTTVRVPDWTGKEPIMFGVRAVVGDVIVNTVGGIDTVSVADEIMHSQGTVWQAGTVPKAPENVELSQTLNNDILVTWDWAWSEADSAEVSWADRENAWESTDEPDSFIVKKVKQSRLNISGLETGKRWYVRVRLIKGTEDNAVYGSYSETKYWDLTSAPAIPELTLSQNAVTEDGSFTANWSYVSTDGTEQAASVIYDVPANAQSEDDYIRIGETTTAQQLTFNVKDDLNWQTGTTHTLVVRVMSESQKWSEFSNPDTGRITVAEPLVCNITETSLVDDEEYVNPVERYGSTVTFEDDGNSEVGSLSVILPYNSNGYDSVTVNNTYTSELPANFYGGSADIVQGVAVLLYDASGNILDEPIESEIEKHTIALVDGENTISSEQGDIYIIVADAVIKGKFLKQMPLTVNVNYTGNLSVAIERADAYRSDRPNGEDLTGYENETIAVINNITSMPLTFDYNSLVGRLDDGAEYKIVVSTQDDLGQRNSNEDDPLMFTVRWSHQAQMPDGEVQIDGTIAKIKPIAPENTPSWVLDNGDYCDIYRLSANKPQLIYRHAEWNTWYVDPYPTIGDKGGYRFVFYTVDGDYIIESDDGTSSYAWKDITDQTFETPYKTIIDFGTDQVRLYNNVDFGFSSAKDFNKIKYLGGTEVGAWNEGVSKSGNVSAVAVPIIETETLDAMRALEDYVGRCHIRTFDGRSYTCDVQVSEDNPHDNAGLVVNFSLSVTKIDPVELDGMKLEDWESDELEQ